MLSTSPGVPTIEPGDRFLRLPAVLELVGIGKTVWTDYVREGRAPASIKIGGATVWLESECRAWMAARLAESRKVA